MLYCLEYRFFCSWNVFFVGKIVGFVMDRLKVTFGRGFGRKGIGSYVDGDSFR